VIPGTGSQIEATVSFVCLTRSSAIAEAARAMLYVVDRLAVTQSHSNLHRRVARKFILVFHCDCVFYLVPFSLYLTLKTVEIVYDFLSVCRCMYNSVLYHFPVEGH